MAITSFQSLHFNWLETSWTVKLKLVYYTVIYQMYKFEDTKEEIKSRKGETIQWSKKRDQQ